MTKTPTESSINIDDYLERYSIEDYDEFSCWEFTLYDIGIMGIVIFILLVVLFSVIAYSFLDSPIAIIFLIGILFSLSFCLAFLRKFTYIISDDRICMFVSHPFGEPVIYEGYSTETQSDLDRGRGTCFYSEVLFDNIDEIENNDDELSIYEDKKVRENGFVSNPPTVPSLDYTRKQVRISNLDKEDLDYIRSKVLASTL